MRYDTPQSVAALLLRYAPKVVRSLLDPAAGSGVLIEPFLRRRNGCKVDCVDVDRAATAGLRERFRKERHVTVHTANFLTWSLHNGAEPRKFDCIVMNPPFLGRRENCVSLRVSYDGKERERKVPPEAAFVFQAISLLNPSGRLLAILPASVVSAQTTVWLRQMMMEMGNVRFVHELPNRIFRGVEGRIYILVFEKGHDQHTIVVRNHRLSKPDELRISQEQVLQAKRLDYRFYDAQLWHQSIQQVRELNWCALQEVADVIRGGVDSPIANDDTLHTTNFFQFHSSLRSTVRSSSERLAMRGDLIIKRVARDCAETAIPFPGRGPAPCSDCVLIVRPRFGIDGMRLLFAIRTVISWSKGKNLVEQGLGASYIPANCLRRLVIPLGLSTRYKKPFKRFEIAVADRRWKELPGIESAVRASIVRKQVSNE